MVSIKNDEERRIWLDKVVDLKKAEQDLSENENGGAIMSCEQRVLVFKDLNLIASAIKAELDEKETGDKLFPFRYSFFYKGIMFFGFFEAKLSLHEGIWMA